MLCLKWLCKIEFGLIYLVYYFSLLESFELQIIIQKKKDLDWFINQFLYLEYII